MKKIISEDKWGWPVEAKQVSEEVNLDALSQESEDFLGILGAGVERLPRFFQSEIREAERAMEQLIKDLDKAQDLIADVLALADEQSESGKDSAGPDRLSQRLDPKYKPILDLVMKAGSQADGYLEVEGTIAKLVVEEGWRAKHLIADLEQLKKDLSKESEEVALD